MSFIPFIMILYFENLSRRKKLLYNKTISSFSDIMYFLKMFLNNWIWERNKKWEICVVKKDFWRFLIQLVLK